MGHHNIGRSCHRYQRFTQSTRWKQSFAIQYASAINEQHIHFSRDTTMLKAIIQDDNITGGVLTANRLN